MIKPNPINTVGVVLIENSKVLLVKHWKKAQHLDNTYGLPAGRIDPGESDRQAAARELNEETGLKINPKDLIKLPTEYTAEIDRKNGERTLMTYKVFIGKKYEGNLANSSETKPEWVDISKLSNIKLIVNVEKAINEGLEEIDKTEITNGKSKTIEK